MFLDLEKFLQHFPKVQMGRKEFASKLEIMYTKPIMLDQAFSLTPIKMKYKGKMINRNPIIKDKNDFRYRNKEAVIDYLYQMIITHRHYYLQKHYEAYFYFPDPFKKMKWNSKIDLHLPQKLGFVEKDKKYKGNLSLQKNDSSRRIVRNLFYLELLHLTKVTNTVKAQVSYWGALDNMYNKLQLEDRLFAPSVIELFLRPKGTKKEDETIKNVAGFKGFNKNLNYHNLFYQLQAYQPKASIINPYFIHWSLENLFDDLVDKSSNGGRILTPVLSWGSYLIGFMHSKKWSHYVGIDVMPSVCEKVNFLSKYYLDLPQMKDQEKKVELYCQPSEKLAKDKSFLRKYKNYFDLIIICPPYYDMELYHEGEQSTDSFPEYEEWLDQYWLETMKMCYHLCRPGGKLAVIMNDYNTLKGKYYPLVEDFTRKINQTKFKYEEFYYLFNRTSPLRANKKNRTERLAIFKK